MWTTVALIFTTFQIINAKDCACALTKVQILNNDAGFVGVALTGECFQLLGNSNNTWRHIQYQGQSAWIQVSSVGIRDCDSTVPTTTPGSIDPTAVRPSPKLSGCPTIVTRADWGAMPPSHDMTLLTKTPNYAFIHHGASSPCSTLDECSKRVRAYQTFHMSAPPAGRGWWDIGYSFMIGEDGNVYEGRGWDEVGAHTYGYNSVGLGISFIGDFRERLPNQNAIDAAHALIKCGVDNGKLTRDYKLKGHRDVGNTECPGQTLYDYIQSWPHYTRH
ncbi:peptidoglycan recognition protein-like [Ostrea edulis]|uniref:peptidoglycan recognition protein-like n=1 Tax=Ostrea edulis TaxID=37623 RepID=UPI002094B07F|nr:peptidoglycan recognition protein-like [Ostrea edulis]XP_056008156.1 peptidoglycan recognition protein-like [Ostrea edulis]